MKVDLDTLIHRDASKPTANIEEQRVLKLK
jgi:hypothetical protein